ncbi:maltose alpha-D-glucosyltransferase [Desulfotignum balticum]|uniref:maltose alpha-D-glucosyltransferase n=1 Tax=Desulfotignum balticum TaxID=115781 RepID=UPI0004108FB9|nr:maltose alpha-D-glucosyltransferase [Desulfotignum balticum]
MAKRTPQPQNDPLWYKDAVIYQLHIKTFYDSNGDGIGDFKGLTEKLGYLQELGVTALWLLPFYPSPLKDDGYDISDFKAINPAYGTLADFKAFMRAARKRNMQVITELVINHTSDQHPWFQRSRRSKPGSAWRNFYVWSDTPEKYTDARIIFQDFESSNWTWDPVAKAYFWHRFYSHQPDLNFDNPKVHDAIFKALDFWMDMGVDGLRLDAIPYLYEREGTNCENLPETHVFLKKLRQRMDEKYQGRMFLAEANQWPEDAVQYFGEGDECHMSFHFPLMPRLYMAVHMESRLPVTEILDTTPAIPESCQWAIFLRNHDELTLEMVTDEERDYMYRAYARDVRMRVNLGIRRRLAPLMGNHRRRIELMYALLLCLPGTPILYYGDEIGMGDNIYLGDRNGVRTPMQWSPDRNAGFSRCNPHQLYLPVITDPEYHFGVLNVEAQKQNRHSLFWWIRRLLTLRSRIPAFSKGDLVFLEPENPKILAFTRRHEDQSVLVVVNLSRFVQYAELDMQGHEGKIPVEIFGNTPFPGITDAPYFLTLGPHGFFWFLLTSPTEADTAADRDTELPVFEVRTQWEEAMQGNLRRRFEKHLRSYIVKCRWFGAKDSRIKSLALGDQVSVGNHVRAGYMLLVTLGYTDGNDETYILPVTCLSAADGAAVMENHPQAVMAQIKMTSKGQEGFLVDGLFHPGFCQVLLEMIHRRQSAKGSQGRLTATPATGFKRMYSTLSLPMETRVISTEQSNTSIIFGHRFILKLFRRLQEGINPDLEISRFLAGRGFAGLPGLAGFLEYTRQDEEPGTVGILQEYVANQGDAWAYTVSSLSGFFERVMESRENIPVSLPRKSLLALSRMPVPPEMETQIGFYFESAVLLARRTAQMHAALASASQDPLFTPEPFSKLYQRALFQSMNSMAGRVLGQLEKRIRARKNPLPEHIHAAAKQILDRRQEIIDRFRALTSRKISAMRLRCHGDFHLGQILHTGHDFVIIDFEGEPVRPVSERRIKRSPLRDVAGLLRSFHYACHVALQAEETRGMFHPELRGTMAAKAEEWRMWVSAQYLGEYLARSADANFLPHSHEDMEVLLHAYLMEKAVYELGYEMNNRPDWINIPLTGIEQLLNET